MRPLVSVVIPMYKCAPYLRRCLDSLVNQTLREIEIVCVNDSSPDNCADIVREYQQKDNRIVLINQKNKGVSGARNTGMKKVHAAYLMWCDPDDFYNLDMCEKMYHSIVDNDVDVACCGTNIIYEADEDKKESDELYYKIKFLGKHNISSKHFLNTDVSLWNKIFKTALIRKNSICFPQGLIYEDACFSIKYFSVSKSIYYSNEKLYNYVRHSSSIMNTTFKKNLKSLDHLKIMRDVYSFFVKNKLLEKMKQDFLILFLNYFGFCTKYIPFGTKKVLYHTAWPIMKKFSAQDIVVLSFWQQEQWRHILRQCYNSFLLK